MILRHYQQEALDRIIWSMDNEFKGNDIVVLPTGAGKSVVIAHLVKQLHQPILILQPSREILEQNLEKLCQYVDRSQIGVYSASMGEKTINHYTFATIQSIYRKPELFAHFKIIIIDECHLVNPRSLLGMFTKFLKDIGNPKVIGFTATPFRMVTHWFDWGQPNERCEATIKLINRMKPFFWQRILYNLNVGDLIDQKFLCPLEYIDRSIIDQANLPLNKTRSDFDLPRFEKAISNRDKYILKIVKYGEGVCKSVLVFCSSVAQATRLAELTEGAEVVSAKTKKKDRYRIILDFKEHRVKTVFNVGVLTTGFDHPSLDCIILLRPTRSIALYYQMLGRGVRISEGKTSCKVIDLTSTVKSMGRVETIKLVKEKMWELISETGSWHNSELFKFYTQEGGREYDRTLELTRAMFAVRAVPEPDHLVDNDLPF